MFGLERLSFIFLQRTIKFFFQIKKELEWSKLACFLNVDMQLVVLNMINHFLVWVFGLYSILDYCDKKYNA